MNVYFAGQEDIDLILSGGGWIGGAGTNYRTAYARQAYNTAVNTSNLSTPSFGNRSLVWAHAQCNIQDNRTSSGFYLVFLWGTAGSAAQSGIGVVGTGTAGQVQIVKRDNAGTLTTLATSAAGVVNGGLLSLDFFVNYAVAGQAQLWIGGVLIVDTGTGVNVTTNSNTGVSQFYMGSAGNNNCYWSEIIVADSDTRTADLCLLNSNTAGNAQQWAGTASNVNQATINDANFISAASAGLIQEYKPAALPTGTFTVAAVVMSSRGEVNAGPQHLEYVTRIGSTDYVGGSWAPPVGGFANNAYIQPLNPGTGVAWTAADLAATNFNYGVESVA